MGSLFKMSVGFYIPQENVDKLFKVKDVDKLYNFFEDVNLSEFEDELKVFYKSEEAANANPDLLFIPGLDFICPGKMETAEELLTVFDGHGLMVSTPKQSSSTRCEDFIDLVMRGSELIADFSVTPTPMCADACTYLYSPDSTEFPPVNKGATFIKNVIDNGKLKEFKSMPSFFYYLLCKKAGVLNDDVKAKDFYDCGFCAVVSSLFY